MRTLTLISLAAMAFALWDHYAHPLPLATVSEEVFTATSAQDAEQDMQRFMDLGLVTRTKQLKREVLVDRAVWERIGEAGAVRTLRGGILPLHEHGSGPACDDPGREQREGARSGVRPRRSPAGAAYGSGTGLKKRAKSSITRRRRALPHVSSAEWV